MTAKKTMHECIKETEIALLIENNKNINDKINDIHKHLVGNGRPGLLERVSNLEIGAKIIYVLLTLIIAGIGISSFLI